MLTPRLLILPSVARKKHDRKHVYRAAIKKQIAQCRIYLRKELHNCEKINALLIIMKSFATIGNVLCFYFCIISALRGKYQGCVLMAHKAGQLKQTAREN